MNQTKLSINLMFIAVAALFAVTSEFTIQKLANFQGSINYQLGQINSKEDSTKKSKTYSKFFQAQPDQITRRVDTGRIYSALLAAAPGRVFVLYDGTSPLDTGGISQQGEKELLDQLRITFVSVGQNAHQNSRVPEKANETPNERAAKAFRMNAHWNPKYDPIISIDIFQNSLDLSTRFNAGNDSIWITANPFFDLDKTDEIPLTDLQDSAEVGTIDDLVQPGETLIVSFLQPTTENLRLVQTFVRSFAAYSSPPWLVYHFDASRILIWILALLATLGSRGFFRLVMTVAPSQTEKEIQEKDQNPFLLTSLAVFGLGSVTTIAILLSPTFSNHSFSSISTGLSFWGPSICFLGIKSLSNWRWRRALRSLLLPHLPLTQVAQLLEHTEHESVLGSKEAFVTILQLQLAYSVNREQKRNEYDQWHAEIAGLIGSRGGIFIQQGEMFLGIFGYDLAQKTFTPGNHGVAGTQCAIMISRLMVDHAERPSLGPTFPILMAVKTENWILGIDRPQRKTADARSSFANTLFQGLLVDGENYEIVAYPLGESNITDPSNFSRIGHIIVDSSTLAILGPIKEATGYDEHLQFTKKILPSSPGALRASLEVNPFHNQNDRYLKATRVWNEGRIAERRENRFLLVGGNLLVFNQSDRGAGGDPLNVQTPGAQIKPGILLRVGHVINFSKTGLQIVLDNYYAKGTQLNFTLDTADHRFASRMMDLNIKVPPFEVKWSEKRGQEFLHGVMFTPDSAASETILDGLFQTMREIFPESYSLEADPAVLAQSA